MASLSLRLLPRPELIPIPVRLSAAMLAANLLLLAALRLLFWAMFAAESEPLDSSALLKALYIGTKFDLRYSILIILPLALAAWTILRLSASGSVSARGSRSASGSCPAGGIVGGAS